VGCELAGETEVLGENLPHCYFVHQKSHMTWPRAAAIGSRRLTTWAMARPHLTNQPTTELTPRSWFLREKPPVAQLLKDVSTLYGTRRFITIFTRAHHGLPSWARWVQSIPPNLLPIRSTYRVHLIVRDFIILIMLDEDNKLWISTDNQYVLWHYFSRKYPIPLQRMHLFDRS
jgi:hypothetical protein